MKLTIHTDGGARGNPGPAAIGVVIDQNGKQVAAFGKTLGETTNNVAEYTAVVEALTWIKNYPMNQLTNQLIIQFFLDSTLVVNQLNGLFKVKDANLRELLTKVRSLEQEVEGVIHYSYIPREENHHADSLVNRALDEAFY